MAQVILAIQNSSSEDSFSISKMRGLVKEIRRLGRLPAGFDPGYLEFIRSHSSLFLALASTNFS